MPSEEATQLSTSTINGNSSEISTDGSTKDQRPGSSLVVEAPTSSSLSEVTDDELEVAKFEIKLEQLVSSSLVESVNTLDDISSLKTSEEESSILTMNEGEGDKDAEGDFQLPTDSSRDSQENNDTDENKLAKQNEDEDEFEWLDVIGSGDLMKKILRKGQGVDTRPQRGNLIRVKLSGCYEKNCVVFEKDESRSLIIGDSEVIQGLDLVFPLMELNEHCKVIVKPRLAFGNAQNIYPSVLPNSTVMYDLELLSVEDDPDPEKLSLQERKAIGIKKREQGNNWYLRGEFSTALHCYRRALDFLDDNSTNFTDSTGEVKELASIWMLVCNNMAAAQIKIGAFDAALKSAENVLKCEPKNVKALYRKQQILCKIRRYEEAIQVLKTLVSVEPKNKIFSKELAHTMSLLKSQREKEKEMYRKMFGQERQSPAPELDSGDTTRKFLRWGLIAGSLTAAIASVVAFRHYHGSANN